MNPFPDGETFVTVEIEIIENCAEVNLDVEEGSQLGEPCDPSSELVRKRRGLGALFESGYRKISEPVVNIYC